MDGTTPATVSTVRSTARYEFLTSEAHTSIATVTGRNLNIDLVNEHACRGTIVPALLRMEPREGERL